MTTLATVSDGGAAPADLAALAEYVVAPNDAILTGEDT